MNAEIISIGSELLLGQIIDSNAAWIANRLAENGVNLFYKTTVGDNLDRMVSIIDKALDRSDVVITGGGIGPTQDDLTREAVAMVTGRKIVVDPNSLRDLRERFQARGFILSKNNEKQATVPENAKIVKNPNGTAPAFIVEETRGVIISLPGVPFEMKWLVDNEVLPYLRNRFGIEQTIHYRVLKVSDLGESAVDEKIGGLISGYKNPTVGVLAHPGQVDIRITALARTKIKANSLIDPVEKEIRDLLQEHIFAVDDETMETIIGKLLAQKNLTVSIYEDLSGGTVAESIRNAAGSLFIGNIVINSEEGLNKMINPDKISTPIKHVEEKSLAIAEAIRKLSDTDIGLAVHGITEGKQNSENLGTGNTYISVAGNNCAKSQHIRSAGSGIPDRRRAAMTAMSLLRQYLVELSD